MEWKKRQSGGQDGRNGRGGMNEGSAGMKCEMFPEASGCLNIAKEQI